MSGIYLKGIDMPEGLAERGFVIRGDGRVRTFVGTVYDDALAYRVPDHGRLVDAQMVRDAMIQKWVDNADDSFMYKRGMEDAYEVVRNAPTIIYADRKDSSE